MLMWRIITAAFLIPLVLFGIFKLNLMGFTLSAAAVLLLAANEWSRLIPLKSLLYKGGYLIAIAGLFIAAVYFPMGMLTIGTLFWLAPLYWCLHYQGEHTPIISLNWIKIIAGMIVLPSAFIALVSLHQLQYGPILILLLFTLVWSTDSFAYFAGRFFGKHPFSPISPKKTWEGFWGGLFCTLLVAGALFYLVIDNFDISISLSQWMGISFVTILLSVLGDLFESLLKRLVNVKDSGRLLPGHGGILDRMDSLLATLPFYALTLKICIVS